MPESELRDHRAARIAVIRPEWGELQHLHPSADNRTCAIITGDAYVPQRREFPRHAYFQERLIANLHGYYGVPPWHPWALSFDGTRLATVEHRQDGQGGFLVRINGAVVHEVSLEGMLDIGWIDDDRLMWSGLYDRTQDRCRCFVDGVETTGDIEFDCKRGEYEGATEIVLWDHGTCSIIRDDGSRVDLGAVRYEYRRYPPNRYPNAPEETYEEPRRLGRARRPERTRAYYRGRSYPPVHLSSEHFPTRAYAYSADRSRIACIAVRHGTLLPVVLAPITLSAMVDEWATAPGRAMGYPEYAPTWRRTVAALVRAVVWLPSIPGTSLLHPRHYRWFEHLDSGSDRYHPVDDGSMWRRGYPRASWPFYTPANELVVTVSDGGKQRVVIDEDEGPPFDAVQNVRFTPSEGCVTYCARRGDEVFRVTVYR